MPPRIDVLSKSNPLRYEAETSQFLHRLNEPLLEQRARGTDPLPSDHLIHGEDAHRAS